MSLAWTPRVKPVVGTCTCLFCNQLFASTRLLNLHYRRHIREKPFTCDFCDFEAICSTGITAHIRCKHRSKFNIQCSVCQKLFPSDTRLQNHFRRRHLPKRVVHCCEICGKIFSSHSALHYHRKTHLVPLSQSPFKCDICGRPFRNKHILQQHKSTVHLDEKRFECLICGQRFTQKNNVKTHQQGGSCKQPGEPEVVPGTNLKVEKTFKCEICGIKISHERNFHQHYKRTHSWNGGGLECDKCGQKFGGKEQLNWHLKWVGGNCKPVPEVVIKTRRIQVGNTQLEEMVILLEPRKKEGIKPEANHDLNKTKGPTALNLMKTELLISTAVKLKTVEIVKAETEQVQVKTEAVDDFLLGL